MRKDRYPTRLEAGSNSVSSLPTEALTGSCQSIAQKVLELQGDLETLASSERRPTSILVQAQIKH